MHVCVHKLEYMLALALVHMCRYCTMTPGASDGLALDCCLVYV